MAWTRDGDVINYALCVQFDKHVFIFQQVLKFKAIYIK